MSCISLVLLSLSAIFPVMWKVGELRSRKSLGILLLVRYSGMSVVCCNFEQCFPIILINKTRQRKQLDVVAEINWEQEPSNKYIKLSFFVWWGQVCNYRLLLWQSQHINSSSLNLSLWVLTITNTGLASLLVVSILYLWRDQKRKLCIIFQHNFLKEKQ